MTTTALPMPHRRDTRDGYGHARMPRNATTEITTEPIPDGATPGNPALPAVDPKAAALNHEQQIAQARTLVNQDPKRVAQVVRGWVAQDE